MGECRTPGYIVWTSKIGPGPPRVQAGPPRMGSGPPTMGSQGSRTEHTSALFRTHAGVRYRHVSRPDLVITSIDLPYIYIHALNLPYIGLALLDTAALLSHPLFQILLYKQCQTVSSTIQCCMPYFTRSTEDNIESSERKVGRLSASMSI
jgi:hypothetical protein